MQRTVTSDELVDRLVRTFFGVEPSTMAVLAQGDAQVRLSDVPALQHVVNQAGADIASLIAVVAFERGAEAGAPSSSGARW